MKRCSLVFLILFTFCFLLQSSLPSLADSWPTKPIRCIVPYKAGGSADSLARGIAPFLEEKLGVPIVIQNQPGASGQIGAMLFLKEPADGYTLFLGVQPYLSKSIFAQGAKYSLDDFAIVNAENLGAISLTVNAESPFGNIGEFITKVRENPGKYSCGTVAGGAMHILALLLQEQLDLDFKIIPSNSGAPVRSNLLGKHIDFATNGAAADAMMKPEVRSLGLSTRGKLAVWPGVPFIGDALKTYGAKIPEIGDIRFFAFRKEFKEQYPERFATFLAAYKEVLESPEYQEYTKKIGRYEETAFRGPEKSRELVLQSDTFFRKYGKKLISGK